MLEKILPVNAANELHSAALDKISEAIIITSPDGRVIYVNEFAAKLCSYTVEALTGKYLYELLPDSNAADWMQKWSAVFEIEEVGLPVRILKKNGETISVDLIAKGIALGDARYILCHVQGLDKTQESNEMLRIISEGTASVVGGDFFRSLAYYLIATTGLRYAIVTECVNLSKTRLRTLVYVERGNFLENFEYDVAETPCEIVMKGNNYYCTSDLDALFPKEKAIKSYFGVPIFLSNGEVIGHIAIFDTVPSVLSSQQLNILKIFASRAAAEIERKRKDEQIRDNMLRYRNLFEDSPIGLGEEDFSRVLLHIAALKQKYQKDLPSIFEKFPEEIKACHQAIRRLAINKAQAKLFSVQNLQEYNRSLDEWFDPGALRDVLVTLDRGQLSFEREILLRTPSGDKRILKAKRAIVPGMEKDWSKIILSCVDITEQKLAQEKLNIALHEVEQLKEKLEAENIYLQEEIKSEHNFEEIVSQSDVFRKVLEKIELVAQTDATVLILGESGTGKELIARAIHSISKRSNRPLVKVNCAALPMSLIESELFGHEKGAFTGAVGQKIGRFELADGGTIFLDEIGEMPVDLQAKLLRVLQEGEFERVGSSKTMKVDVRIITATNRDLQKSVNAKEFRSDLFYRLNVFPVWSPPLRERKDDIPILVNHFCKKYGNKFGKKVNAVSKVVLDNFMNYDWPGNVRELENVVERGMIVSKGNQLDPGDWLPIASNEPPMTEREQTSTPTFTMEEMERKHILEVLAKVRWKIRGENGAAKILNLNPTTLEARMKKLNIIRNQTP